MKDFDPDSVTNVRTEVDPPRIRGGYRHPEAGQVSAKTERQLRSHLEERHSPKQVRGGVVVLGDEEYADLDEAHIWLHESTGTEREVFS